MLYNSLSNSVSSILFLISVSQILEKFSTWKKWIHDLATGTIIVVGGMGDGELDSCKMSVFFLDRENRIRKLNHKLPLNRGTSILGIKSLIGHRDTQEGRIHAWYC